MLLSCRDLNHNKLAVIGMGAISNLPELISLILHSQNAGLQTIQFNAFNNIGAKLKSLQVVLSSTHLSHLATILCVIILQWSLPRQMHVNVYNLRNLKKVAFKVFPR